jgi:hypothetical protein
MTTTTRITGISGILVFVLSIVAIALVASTGLTEQNLEAGAVDTVLQSMAAHSGTFAVSMWTFLIANSLGAVFGIGIYTLLKDERPWLRFALFALVVGFAAFIVETLMTIGIGQGLAPAYVEAAETERVLLGAVALSLIQFRNHTALYAGLLVAVAALLFGQAVFRAEVLPRWMGYIAIISGLLGIAGAFWPLAGFLSFVRAFGFFIFLLWALIGGIILLRTK